MMNYDNFTKLAQKALKHASQIAKIQKHKSIENGHILKGIFDTDKNVTPFLLKRLKVDSSDLEDMLDKIIASYTPLYSGKLDVSSFVEKSLNHAMQFSRRLNDEFISVEHILHGLLDANDSISNLLRNKGITHDGLLNAINELRKGLHAIPHDHGKYYLTLKKFAINLNEKAKSGSLDPVIGRSDEIRRILEILSRRRKNNPIITGEAGVGKTAVVEGFVQRIIRGDVPDNLKNCIVFSVDLTAILAGASKKGEFEDRIKRVIKEAENSDGEVILFIDEIHNLVGAGTAGGTLDAANILKPALARGTLKTIGATTLTEYKSYIETDKALDRRFQRVLIEEPSEADAISILRGLKEKYESHHKVRITDGAITASVELSQRYITDRFLPDKAIDLMDQAASRVRIEMNSLPEEVDDIERKINQLKIEKQVLKQEENVDATNKLKSEIAALSDERNRLRAIWESERDIITRILSTKENLVKYKFEMQQAEHDEQYTRAAELKYEKIKNAEEDLEKLQNELETKHPNISLFKEHVDKDVVSEIVSDWTGIPITKLMQNEKEKLLHLEKELGKRIIGQNDAVSAVANAIRRSRTGLHDAKRPIGSFFFLGTTGVGKTELAKALAEYLFNDENAITRIDMSEYQERHTVSKLIGAPPGYVGHGDGGQLTDAVRHRPYSVILFDEMEKAHSDVFNTLLQVLDDGRLTDSKGRTVNFRNAIIIMTTNAGSEIIHRNFAQLTASNRLEVIRKTKFEVSRLLKKNISPEFLNRIDEIIMFSPLSYQEIKQIVTLQFKRLQKRLVQDSIHIHLQPLGLDWLTRMSYNPRFGARPVKRTLQRYVINEISQQILKGEVSKEAIINIDYDDGVLAFRNITESELEQLKKQPIPEEPITIPEQESDFEIETDDAAFQKKKRKGIFAWFRRLLHRLSK